MPGRLSSGSGLAPRGRGEACQRSLGNHPRSGSWLYSHLFLVDLTSDCWRPLIILSTMNEFALLTPFPKNSIILCCFSSERGFFSSSFGSGNRVFSDPITSILMNAFEDPRQRGRSIHSAPCIFWSVGRSPALSQGLRSGVCVGTLSRGMPSRLSGQLALSCLLGARSLTDGPVAVLQLSLPRDCGRQGGARHGVLADCDVLRYLL